LQTARGSDRERARGELAAWRGRLFAVHPELGLARGAAEIPSLSQLHEIVGDPATVVLAYAAVDNRTWLFVITSGRTSEMPTLAVHRLAIDNDTLATRVHHLRDGLAHRRLDFAADARALYTDLLQPAADALRGATRLVIVPDGVLWDLPFQALQPASTPGHYLVERAIIEYAPSLTFLWGVRHAPGEAREHLQRLLALGNPVITPGTTATAAPAPLPDSEREVRALAALYGPRQSTLLVGAAASEQRVKAEAGRYRVLHFATHGVLDDRDPMYSAVLLAHDPKNDAEDGRLEAREWMDLDLHADLVVLSACDTARGRFGAGEGLLGLSWAMLLAGSRDVVVSQWQVDAGSTSQLMIAFHGALVHQRTAPDIGAALQRAARQVMQDPRYRHPFYWAAFRTVGVGH
jgi:CHAT domain-containing protein